MHGQAHGRIGHGQAEIANPVADRFFSSYTAALQASIASGDYSLPDQLLRELGEYQKTKGAAVMPSDSKISAEIFFE